jgi:hypothetical protein
VFCEYAIFIVAYYLFKVWLSKYTDFAADKVGKYTDFAADKVGKYTDFAADKVGPIMHLHVKVRKSIN